MCTFMWSIRSEGGGEIDVSFIYRYMRLEQQLVYVYWVMVMMMMMMMMMIIIKIVKKVEEF